MFEEDLEKEKGKKAEQNDKARISMAESLAAKSESGSIVRAIPCDLEKTNKQTMSLSAE